MIGAIIIKLGFVCAIAATVFYFLGIKRGKRFTIAGSYAYLGVFVSILAASALLLTNILSHDFRFTYVWNYSSTDLPLPLLISTFYAGQEGSLLLWALYTGLIGIFLLRYSRRNNYEAETMGIFSLILTFLLTMLIVKSPFMFIWDSFPNDLVHNLAEHGDPALLGVQHVWLNKTEGLWAQIPAEGKGLNPLLQNYWMVIHPQVLFMGFAAMAVPYTLALAGMLKKDYQSWIKVAIPWSVFGGLVLGLGIMLGGYWAYETLGWGGYWAWDPVENSSLVPWLLCVASIHTAMVQGKNGNYVKTNFVLSILTFVSVLYSSFLTRSGVLGDTSVHSFVSPGMWAYVLLLVFLGGFTILGFGIFAWRFKQMPKPKVEHSVFSKEFALFLGASALTLVALFTIIGTSAPLITSLTEGKPSAVEMSYYIVTNLPLGIAIALLSGLAQLLWWKRTGAISVWKVFSIPVTGAVIVTALMLAILGTSDLQIALFSFFAAFSLFANLQVGYGLFIGNPVLMGGTLTHIGFAIMCLGFVSSSYYSDTKQVSLELGKTERVLGYGMTYRGARDLPDEKYGFVVELDKEGRKKYASPVMYFSTFTNGVIRNPDVLNLINRDIYIAPLGLEQPTHAPETTILLKKGGSATFEGLSIQFIDFDLSTIRGREALQSGEFTFSARVLIEEGYQKTTLSLPVVNSAKGVEFPIVPFRTGSGKDLQIHLHHADSPFSRREDEPSIEIAVAHAEKNQGTGAETLVIEASVKPMINLVWVGTLTLILGFGLTLYRRWRENLRQIPVEAEPQ